MVNQNEPIQLLDKGYVTLLDGMPHVYDSIDLDYGVLRGARPEADNPVRSRETNLKLLRTLWNADPRPHSSPFEQPTIWLEIKAPDMVWRQLNTHRWLSKNLFSGRYHEYASTDFYIPDKWRRQSLTNHQGSDGYVNKSMSEELSRILAFHAEMSFKIYKKVTDDGVAREMARLFLPAWSLYVTGVVQLNLWSMINIVAQRADDHAQWETQQYGYAFLAILRDFAPLTAEVVFGPRTAEESDRIFGFEPEASGATGPAVVVPRSECEYCDSEPDGYGLCEECGGCEDHCDGDCS